MLDWVIKYCHRELGLKETEGEYLGPWILGVGPVAYGRMYVEYFHMPM